MVDTERTDHAVIEYVPFTHRVSNVALGGDNRLYVTGEGHLWRLPLAGDAWDSPDAPLHRAMRMEPVVPVSMEPIAPVRDEL